MSPSKAKTPIRPGRRLLFALVIAAGVILAIELLGRGLLLIGVLEGGSVSALVERRRELVEEASHDDLLGAEELARGQEYTTLHPFVGKVLDPTSPNLPRQRRPELQVSREGYFVRDAHRPLPEDAFVVAFFGGSVALNLAMSPLEDLRRELEAHPALEGRPVVFLSRALGSYKQPQQVSALLFALTRGERFDVVVNLDGFNDLVLPVVANLNTKVSPYYPNDWLAHSGATRSFEVRRRTGRLSFLEERRLSLAGSFETPWLSWSAPWNLAWAALDRRLARHLEAAELELREAAGKRRQYRTHGPRRRYKSDEETFRDLARFWAESSLQMHRLAEANGILYLHFLQPNQYVPGSKPLSREERTTAWRDDSVHRPVVEAGWQYFRVLGPELKDQGVRFTDLTEAFAGVEETVYIDTCCHVGVRGNRILSETVGRELARALESGPPAAAGHLR